MNRVVRAAGGQMLTRRDLFRRAGLALGGIAVAGGSRAQSTTAPRIGIVGGGIAGLTAALTLQDAGLPCTVYESAGRIGGRMHSNTKFWQQGQISEWCGEFIDSDHHLIRHLAKRFGIPLVDVNAADPPGSIVTNYFQGGYYTNAELHQDMQAIIPILAKQNKEIGKFALYNHYTPAGYHFDHMSAFDWIEEYVPGGHSSRLGQYLDVGTNTENGLDTRQQTALNVIFPLNSDERYHMNPGNQALPVAIHKALPAGTVNLGWRLTAVAANDPGVTLTFATAAGTQTVTFDYAILTLPFSVLRGVDLTAAGFDALKMTSIQQMAYGTNSKLVLQFDDRYWNGTGPWPHMGNGFIMTDRPFQSTWESSRGQSGADGLLTNFTGGKRGADYRPKHPYTTSHRSSLTAGYAKAFLHSLDVVWPGVSTHYNGLAALSYPTGDPNLLGSYSTYGVGQYTEFGGYERVPQGRIYFAGEHTSYEFQGYMEGGAESGQRAAKEVLAAVAG